MGSAHAAAREVTGVEVLALIEALSRGLPGDRLVVDPDVLAAISHDDAEWAPAGQAAAGVRARTEAEVQHVVRTCAELGVPVVPRGAGTGLSGGATQQPPPTGHSKRGHSKRATPMSHP
jgi:FAD binding domain